MLTVYRDWALISGSAYPSGAPDFRICSPFRSTWFQYLLTLQEHLLSGSAYPSGAPDFRICPPFRSTWFQDLLTLQEHLISGSAPPSWAPDFRICLHFRSTWFQDQLTFQEHLISGSAYHSGAPDFRICSPFRSTWFHPRFLVGFALVDLECMFCRSLIVSCTFSFVLAIVLSVLQCTDSDYPFGISKPFLHKIIIYSQTKKQNKIFWRSKRGVFGT